MILRCGKAAFQELMKDHSEVLLDPIGQIVEGVAGSLVFTVGGPDDAIQAFPDDQGSSTPSCPKRQKGFPTRFLAADSRRQSPTSGRAM